jgi:hypothetical protein
MENKYKKYQERLLPRHNLRCKLMASSPETGFYYPLIKWGDSESSETKSNESMLIYDLDSIIRKMNPIKKIIDNNFGVELESDMFRHERELMRLFDSCFENYSSQSKIYERIMFGTSDCWIPSEVKPNDKYLNPIYYPDNIIRMFEQELQKQVSSINATIEIEYSDYGYNNLIIHDYLPESHIPVYITGDVANDFIQDAIEHFTRDSHPVFRVLLARHYFNHNFRTIDEDLDIGFDFESDFAESTINPNVVCDRITENRDEKSQN